MIKQKKRKKGRPPIQIEGERTIGRTVYFKKKQWEIIDELRGEDALSRWFLSRFKGLLTKHEKLEEKRNANLP